jgi:hypothetical protein
LKKENLIMGHCDNSTALAKLSTPSRNHYFYGKLLDAHHFEMEQVYFNRKRWLLNRLGLGYGVLCGLDVTPNGDGQVIISPGVAIDGLGREIIVPESRPIDPHQLTDECGKLTGEQVEDDEVWICLAYHECEEDLVPVLVGDCDSDDCAPSTICERYRVLVRPGPVQVWRPRCRLGAELSHDDQGTILDESREALVNLVLGECQAPETHCVPLAQVSIADSELTDIDMYVRPVVLSNERLLDLMLCLEPGEGEPPPEPELPYIKRFSWTHAGAMELGDPPALELTVEFSEEASATSDPGEAWFLVTVLQPLNDPTMVTGLLPGTVPIIVPADDILPRSGDSSSTAFFKANEGFLQALVTLLRQRQGSSILCRVVLKCDFLYGEGSDAVVDGDYFGGELPSGDGVPGGDFESWFYLTAG